uniref:hypothetical protein n=1 Tax=Roseivirga sp. TaxID=1964215 RepID=UPI0040486924
MKKILLFLLLIISASSLSQTSEDSIQVVFGPTFKAESRWVPTKYLGADESGYYFVFSNGKFGTGHESIHRFGYDLKPLNNKSLDINVGEKIEQPEHVFMLNKKLFLVNRTVGLESDHIYLYEIMKENFELGNGRLLGVVPHENRRASQALSSLIFSKDSTKVSLFYNVPSAKRSFEQLQVHSFDSDFNELWTKSFEIPFEKDLIDLENYNLDQNGNLYLTAKRYYQKKRRSINGKVNYDYVNLKFTDSGEVQVFEVQSNGNFLIDLKLAFQSNGDVVSSGIYSENGTIGLAGVFLITHESTTADVKMSSFKRFDLDFYTANTTNTIVQKSKSLEELVAAVHLDEYKIDNMILKPDGGVSIYGERQKVIQTTMPGGGAIPSLLTSSTVSYQYGDILIVDIKPDGQINWSERIAKRQNSVSDQAAYSSYIEISVNSDFLFIYNDNAKNLDYSGSGRVANIGKSDFTLTIATKVDAEGNISRKELFSRGQAQIKVRPSFSFLLNSHELLLFGNDEALTDQRFIRLKFKKP